MKLYGIIPHVADIRLQVRGRSLEEIFKIALEGMNLIMLNNYERYLNKKAVVKEIKLLANDQTSLLVDFLSEVLTLSHINKAIFHTITKLHVKDNSLYASILGVKINKFDEDIKGVTYHEAQIKQNKKGDYETTIIFDI